MSAPEETGFCAQCGGDLTLNADETSWQCEADACALRGRPQAPVTDEDRETMRAFESLEDVYRTYFAPEPEPEPKRRRWPFGRGR